MSGNTKLRSLKLFPLFFICVSFLLVEVCFASSSNVVAVETRHGEALSIFVRGEENVLFHKTLIGLFGKPKLWKSTVWKRIPGSESLSSHPAAAKMKDGSAVVFARGAKNELHGSYELVQFDSSVSTRQESRWSTWARIGGGPGMASLPIVGNLKDGRLVLLSLNFRGRVQYAVQEDEEQFELTEWREIGSLPVSVSGLPKLIRTPEGDVHVFVVGTDTNIYTARVSDKYVWTPWRIFNEGGPTHSAVDTDRAGADHVIRIEAASTPGGRLALFAFDDSNILRQSFQRLANERYWTPWVRFVPRVEGPPTLNGVSVVRDEDTELLTVVARSAKNSLYVRKQDRTTGWTQWAPLGGHVKRDPFLVSEASSGVHVLAVGLDGVVIHMALTREGNTEWTALPGVLAD